MRKYLGLIVLFSLFLATGCETSDFSTKSQKVNPAFLLLVFGNQPYTIATYSGTLCTSASASCTPLASTSFYIDVTIGTSLLSTTTTATSGSDGKFTLTNTYTAAINNATALRFRTAALDREARYSAVRCGFSNLCVTGATLSNSMGVSDLVAVMSAPAASSCPTFPCPVKED